MKLSNPKFVWSKRWFSWRWRQGFQFNQHWVKQWFSHLPTLHSDETHNFGKNLTRCNKISIDLRRSLLDLVRFALYLTNLRHAPWSWGGRQLRPIWLSQTQSFFGWVLVILIVDGVFEILKLDIVGLGTVWWAIQPNLTCGHPK